MVNVLVLDDDFFVGQIHARYVDEVPGFTALEPVRDLRTARDVIAENDVDLLLVDYVLPEGTESTSSARPISTRSCSRRSRIRRWSVRRCGQGR